ncbi:hypothetical protein K1719_009608 [Acacia pycnantha]|nr:hypothetical protein K1719_009608 [Acacia pycnantha]
MAELGEPFIEKTWISDEQSSKEKSRGKESITCIFISTLAVVVGSYEFGSCFSLFGSLVNVGAVSGAITSGHMADQFGWKGAGFQKEFIDILRKFRGDNADISHEAAEIQEYLQTLTCMPKVGMLDLFHRRYLHAVTIGVGLMILEQFGGISGIGFYANETFVSAVVRINNETPKQWSILMVAFGGISGIGFYANETFVSAVVRINNETPKQWSILALCSFIINFASKCPPRFHFWQARSYSIWLHTGICNRHIRGMLPNRNIFPFEGTFYVYSGFCAVTVVFMSKVVPETKGKTLEGRDSSLPQFSLSPQ